MSVFLLVAGSMVSCNRPYEPAIPVDKLGLSNAISAAIQLLATTYEGAAAGNYIHGSQATLIAAITTAQNVYVDAAATQDEINATINNLNSSVALYKNQKVIEIDPVNLVGQWTFDRMGPTSVGVKAKDQSGHGHDGVLSAGHPNWGGGVPTNRTDRYGVSDMALQFNRGANVEIPYADALNPSALSVSVWVFEDVVDTILNNQYVISMNRKNGYELHFQHLPKIAVMMINPAESPGNYITEDNGSALSSGVWMHLVVTFGDGHMKFYVNGLLVKEAAHAGTVIKQSPGINLVFGQDLPTSKYTLAHNDPFSIDGGGYFIGGMDEVRLYKSVLSQEQVTAIYNLEKP